MGSHSVKDETLYKAVAAFAKYGEKQAAADALSIPRTTLRHRLKMAQMRGIDASSPPPETPNFPPSDISFNKVRDLQRQSFDIRQRSYEAHTWFPLKHKSNMPVAYAFVGDPHGDDDGHNVTQFNRDMDLLAKTEGVEAVNMGDLTNNWPEGGRLASKYGDQRMSRKDAISFVRWMLNLPVRWRVLLMGNHDSFGRDTEELIREVARDKDLIIHKWEARFRVEFPNGRTVLCRCAHDLKGNSWFHELHGNIRSLLECPAHLTIAGHHHDHAYMRREVPQIAHLINDKLPFIAHLARVRGYKHMDDYALVKGFPDHQEGASAMAVIDPQADTGGGFVRFFMDLAAGCEELKRLRKTRQ